MVGHASVPRGQVLQMFLKANLAQGTSQGAHRSRGQKRVRIRPFREGSLFFRLVGCDSFVQKSGGGNSDNQSSLPV